MKHIFIFIFCVVAFNVKSQCTLTSSTVPESCPGNCDASVTFSLSSGCTAFPYKMVISGTCTPTGTITLTSSVTSFTGLCSCNGLNTVILYNSFNIPISFTNFTLFGGVPLTVFATSVQASCSSCCDGTLSAFVAGGTAPYTYLWTGPSSFSAIGTPSLTNACPGSYTLCVTDNKGCVSCSTYTLGFATGIAETQASTVKMIQTKEELVFSNSEPVNIVKLYDLTGRLVFETKDRNEKEIRISTVSLGRGIYVAGVESNGRILKTKVVID